MQREHGGEQEELQALSRPLSPQVIPFSVPRTEYAFFHLFLGSLSADGGASLLEKLYVCWNSDVGCDGNGVEERAGGSLSPRWGAAGLGCFGASGSLCDHKQQVTQPSSAFRTHMFWGGAAGNRVFLWVKPLSVAYLQRGN